MVRQVMERNDQFIEQNTQLIDEVRQNRELIKQVQVSKRFEGDMGLFPTFLSICFTFRLCLS